MKIEIVEFYESERDDAKGRLRGTLHVYITDLALDLRGIGVIRNKDVWHFNLPGRVTLDKETQEKVFYPYFSFLDREKNAELRAAIREAGVPFIRQKLFENKTAMVAHG